MRNTRTSAGVLALSLLVAATASAAPPSADTLPTQLRFAMQRDLDIKPQQIPQYLDAERIAASAEREARTRLGARYAGTWLERDAKGNYRTVVASTHPGTVMVRGIAQPTRVVAYSLSKLESAQAKLDAVARNASRTTLRSVKGTGLDVRIHSWHVDPRSNRLVITTDIGAGARAAEFVYVAGVDRRMVTFKESAARPRTTAFDIRGGDGYSYPTPGRPGYENRCSIGFAVTLGVNNGFVTAGHCGPTGQNLTHINGQSVGYIYQSVFPGSDYAVVHNTNPQGIPRPWVNAYQYGGNLVVRGAQPAVIGAAVCRSGRTSGASCGTLLNTNMTINYAEGQVSGLSSTTACADPGDSGGSFVTPEGQAQGVLSGGRGHEASCSFVGPVQDPTRSYYQPIAPVLAAFPGLTLVTSP